MRVLRPDLYGTLRMFELMDEMEDDIDSNIARAALFDASDSLQRFYKLKRATTNEERFEREYRLYEAAKKFVEIYERITRR